jgi:hypothetical protein
MTVRIKIGALEKESERRQGSNIGLSLPADSMRSNFR